VVDARIFAPAFAMVGLTVVVTFRMFFERVRQMRSERIGFADIPSSSQMAARFADTRAADNYRNLFEMPVLFYLALLVVALAGLVAPVSLGLAWAYVLLRCLHSAIHCGYNRVKHRFYAFLASNLVLWALWAWLGWRLLAA
jgi:hypothetical protein